MGKKILLADDSITIQKVIELTFSDEDFEVVTVGNGRLAVERVQEVRPDVVLCDIIMPEKDGYEVCDFIKKTTGLSHIPVLLLTGAFEPFDKDKAERVKADGFLSKPFEPQALIARVKDLLQAGPRAAAAPRAQTPAPQAVVRTPTPPPAPPQVPSPVASPAPAARPPIVEAAAFIPDEAVVASAPPAAAAKPPAVEDEGFGYVDDSFEAIPEEAVVVPTPAAPPAPAAPTVISKAPAEEWAQTTVEVSLEARAKAGIESAQAAQEAPVFEEVFEDVALEPTPPAPPIVVARAAVPAPEPPKPTLPPIAVAPPKPAPPPAPEPPKPIQAPVPAPVVLAPPPKPSPPPIVSASPTLASRPAPVVALEPEFEDASFADSAPAEKPAPAPATSEAAGLPVPVDMVEKIAQRVVAQISEKVVREIAWEVVPELAEALIKQEIERLKAELQET